MNSSLSPLPLALYDKGFMMRIHVMFIRRSLLTSVALETVS